MKTKKFTGIPAPRKRSGRTVTIELDEAYARGITNWLRKMQDQVRGTENKDLHSGLVEYFDNDLEILKMSIVNQLPSLTEGLDVRGRV